ncbi:hypothetical protein Si067_01086 [Streptococcus infantarius subsp. infantarius]|nr:hypothetical protein [Streptococcus infantarius subsp. infantarius]
MIPKFRFFGKVADGTMRMVYPGSIDFENGYINYSYRGYTAEGDEYVDGDVICFEDFILMQSTCLFDKNGMEIYEGDIVKFSDCDDDVYITPVVWDKNYACFGVSFSGGYPISFDYLEEFYTELKDIEVVGDIYENPELLEGE